jgi:hypothetical protein
MRIAQYQPIQNTQNCLLQKDSYGESHHTPRRNPKSPHFLERDALSRTRSSYILAINFMGLG